MTEDNDCDIVLEVVPFRGKKIQAMPKNRILVSLTGFFSNFLSSTPILFIWEFPVEIILVT